MWFSTIIYCLSADSDRVEDFEISIINDLIAEKNNVNVVITHCKSENDAYDYYQTLSQEYYTIIPRGI